MKVKELLTISRADFYTFDFETKDSNDVARCLFDVNIFNNFSDFDWLLEKDVVGLDSGNDGNALKVYLNLSHK